MLGKYLAYASTAPQVPEDLQGSVGRLRAVHDAGCTVPPQALCTCCPCAWTALPSVHRLLSRFI